MRFLLIEDQKDVRNLMQAFLGEFGTCDMAEDGIEGLTSVLKSFEEKTPYDAIFLDIMMPKLEGQQVLQKIRELEESKDVSPQENVKIIMASALGDSENVMEAFKSQADAYLVKPILKDKLISTMKKA
ncbi:MAG: response regulator, partial [Candidatus Marinimicrobia bacterium]|nr:response regulator [Candidatus Neomarinimicrobiota bacterium]